MASVRAAGADAVIDLSAADLRDSLRSQVYAATEGRGADIILDPLGGPIFEAAMRALAWRGRLVVIGFAAGPIPTIRTNYLLLKNVEISGLQISDYRKRRPALVAACFAEIFSLYEEGRIRPAKAIAFPLGRAGEALAALRDRRIAGRAVLQLYQQSPKQQTTTDPARHATRTGGDSRPFGCLGIVEIRHAGIHSVIVRDAADRQRQIAKA